MFCYAESLSYHPVSSGVRVASWQMLLTTCRRHRMSPPAVVRE